MQNAIIHYSDNVIVGMTKKGGEYNMKIDKQKLDVAMGNACLTLDAVSKKTGVSITTLTRIRSGQQEPRPVTVGKIAKVLDVKVEDLVD